MQERSVGYMCFKILLNFTKWHFSELLQHSRALYVLCMYMFKMLETKLSKEDFLRAGNNSLKNFKLSQNPQCISQKLSLLSEPLWTLKSHILFSLFCDYLSFEAGLILYFNNLESPLPLDCFLPTMFNFFFSGSREMSKM